MNNDSFHSIFGREATAIAEAPGRVNLIGEHTDYSGGYVLPIATRLRTRVELAPRNDDVVHVSSANLLGSIATYRLGEERQRHEWVDYVQGATVALRSRHVPLRGFDARIESTVPVGGGLSSSAALEIGLFRALRAAFALDLGDVALAHLSRAVENDFVGAPVGIMDQMACSLADTRDALFLDTRSLEFRRIPMPHGVELVVIDSGIAHDHSTGDYKTRKKETEDAAALLGVAMLRDVGLERIHDVDVLPAPLNRRARHVVTENARVLEAVDAMKKGDLVKLGQLFAASHASMRDDFEVSVPTVDRLVEVTSAHPDVYGARLTGGGFGGAIIALVKTGCAHGVVKRVVAEVPGSRALIPGIRE